MNTKEAPELEKEKDKQISIIVNGRERKFSGKEITFRQVVELAFPSGPFNDQTIYTVTYKKGEGHKPDGTMVEGQTVKVKEGMIFNVTQTNKS